MTSKVKSHECVKTRFAPSPTGMLHIGGARTALFSKLYARHTGGEFLVRIEDTDKERNSDEAVQAITEGMDWLGLAPDSQYVYQSDQIDAHKDAVQNLLDNGYAYKVNRTEEPNGEWSEVTVSSDTPNCAVRLDTQKISDDFELYNTIKWKDAVQGKVEYKLDNIGGDLIIARSDGTPTYNLAVTVDDASMEITHVIRGDDHINNTPKQILIYTALGLEIPTFAHIPLIHGADGKKLSKRHGAISAYEFKEQGYLPEAVCNYLLRLGWSNGDDEVISTDEAIKLFDICNVNKGASTFNTKKLDWLNAQYIKKTAPEKLILLIKPFLEKCGLETTKQGMEWIEKSLPELSQRAKRLTDLAESAVFYLKTVPLQMDEKAKNAITGDGAKYLSEATELFSKAENWNQDTLHDIIHNYCESNDYKFGQVAMPLRSALTGTTNSPSVFHIMEVIGREESLKRLRSCLVSN